MEEIREYVAGFVWALIKYQEPAMMSSRIHFQDTNYNFTFDKTYAKIWY